MMDEEAGAADSGEQPDSDCHYVYYKGKGVNINIYHKQTEIQKKGLPCDTNKDYNFLRIEVQVKKSKLNTIVSKFGLNKGELRGRELDFITSPEVEEYVLNNYVKRLTGTGHYVTYEWAMQTIDASGYTKAKKERLKKVVEAVAKQHGIAKMLEQVENGKITEEDLKEISKL